MSLDSSSEEHVSDVVVMQTYKEEGKLMLVQQEKKVKKMINPEVSSRRLTSIEDSADVMME